MRNIMYKYILWDIDNTILDFLAAEEKAIKELFPRFHHLECSDEMLKVYSKLNKEYWEKLERNEIDKQVMLIKRFEDFFSLYHLDISKAKAFNDEYQQVLGNFPVFIPNAKEILLKQKDKYILIGVTNGTKIAQNKKLTLSGLDKIFDRVFISEDIGYEKPSIDYFDYVFNTLNIKNKDEVIIIGDSLSSDIKGGYFYGIDTCWFNPLKLKNTTDIIPTYSISNLIEIINIIK